MDKKLLFSMLLAVTSVWAFQYFTSSKQTAHHVQTGAGAIGGSVKIPSKEELQKPLVFDVEYIEEKNPKQENIVSIKTDFVTANFTAFGGLLDSIEYREHLGKNKKPLKTVYHQIGYDQKNRSIQAFLLAFEKKTPYFYELVDRKSFDDREAVIFQTKHAGWNIRKMYEVFKESYKIDVTVSFEPTTSNAPLLKPRLFFVAPYVHEVSDNTVASFVLNEKSGSIEKFDSQRVNDMAWYWANSETIVGAEDKYFAHSLVNDPAKFVQRAYFKYFDQKSGVAILEGQTVKEKKFLDNVLLYGAKAL